LIRSAAPAGHPARERGGGPWRGQPHRREPEGPRGDGPDSPVEARRGGVLL